MSLLPTCKLVCSCTGKDKLSKSTSDEKWDRVKIVCTQPYNKVTLSLPLLHASPDINRYALTMWSGPIELYSLSLSCWCLPFRKSRMDCLLSSSIQVLSLKRPRKLWVTWANQCAAYLKWYGCVCVYTWMYVHTYCIVNSSNPRPLIKCTVLYMRKMLYMCMYVYVFTFIMHRVMLLFLCQWLIRS